jgi:hypothetical protein
MTKTEKCKFVHNLCKNLQEYCLSKIDNMPEEWDGIELRQFIADVAIERFCSLSLRSNTARRREYKNEKLVRAL